MLFQSRKRFRHCWSSAQEWQELLGCCFNRESDSVTVGAARKNGRSYWDAVSIAKAIPSLLEPDAPRARCAELLRFNRESDSVTVGAFRQWLNTRYQVQFQSRKRFRHCWSQLTPGRAAEIPPVSIAKAIPSLLEHTRYQVQTRK